MRLGREFNLTLWNTFCAPPSGEDLLQNAPKLRSHYEKNVSNNMRRMLGSSRRMGRGADGKGKGPGGNRPAGFPGIASDRAVLQTTEKVLGAGTFFPSGKR